MTSVTAARKAQWVPSAPAASTAKWRNHSAQERRRSSSCASTSSCAMAPPLPGRECLFAEHEVARAPLAIYEQERALAGGLLECRVELRHRVDGLSVHLHDQVARLDAALGRIAAGCDARYHHALLDTAGQVQALPQLGVEALERQAFQGLLVRLGRAGLGARAVGLELTEHE